MTTFHIANDFYWSRMTILNMLVTSSGQEWQFHIATDIHWSRLAHFILLQTSSCQEWQFELLLTHC